MAASTHKSPPATRGKSTRNPRKSRYTLRLYVAGMTPQSTRAILAARNLCQEYLAGKYELEVVDIYQRPTLARDEQIIAVPTLVKQLPPPLRKLIGDLSDLERVLVGLDLRSQKQLDQ